MPKRKTFVNRCHVHPKKKKRIPNNMWDITFKYPQNPLFDKLKRSEYLHNTLCKNATFPDIEKTLNNCMNGGVKLKELLGSGSYGSVFNMTQYGIDKAVKVIGMDNYLTMDQIREFTNEIKLSSYMGNINIGPKVYYAFYVKIDTNKYTQFIIMEKFKNNLHSYYANINPKSKLNEIDSVTRQMLSIIDILTTSGILCVDLKPENFVFKRTLKKIKVKMIDFGTDFCISEPTNMLSDIERVMVNIILKMQMYFMIKPLLVHHSHINIVSSAFFDYIFKARTIPSKSSIYPGGTYPKLSNKNIDIIIVPQIVNNIMIVCNKYPIISKQFNWYYSGVHKAVSKRTWTNLVSEFCTELDI